MKNLNKKNFEILDCTLRDGGYYNNWDFSKSVIQSYLYKTYSTGIRYVELGFRFNDMSSKKGLTAYTKKSLISSLNIPLDLNVGVMINVGDLIQNNKLQINVLKNLINKDNIKRINFIRFACHQNEIFYLTKCFKYLKKLKLKIFVNIMQISEITSLNLKKILTFLNKNQIDNIYIADSLGSLHKKQLKKIIIILNKHWKGELGIHAHDNLNLALKNSLIAIANDFKWIDSTITGMGRGPGNLKTEEILKYSKKYKSSNDFLKLKNYFLKQKKIYKWGTNKYYKFAALKKIHPTYIQKILSDKRYSVKEYNKILISLSKLDTRKFNPYKLANSANFISTKSIGTWSPKSILKNKNVLILGPGKNLKLNKRKIENTIKKQKLFVISLNTFSSINEKYINLRAICHPFRISSDKNQINKLNSKFVAPVSSFSEKFKKTINFNSKNFFDYGLVVKKSKNQILVKKNYCILPNPLAIGYALSLIISGQAKSLKVAGFDGFKKSNPDYDDTEDLLKFFIKKYLKNKITSLTKTNLKLLRYSKKK